MLVIGIQYQGVTTVPVRVHLVTVDNTSRKLEIALPGVIARLWL